MVELTSEEISKFLHKIREKESIISNHKKDIINLQNEINKIKNLLKINCVHIKKIDRSCRDERTQYYCIKCGMDLF
jgi:ABC-type Fe3+-citrate transport system substrate-binding protein